jgi:cytochrome c556
MMIRTVLAVTVVAVGVTAAVAQSVIADRKALMKRSGDQAKLAASMIRGEAPFDLAKAKGVFETYVDKANKLTVLFPDNSKTGGETQAAAAIWQKPDDWKAQIAKFGSDAKAGLEQIKDVESFRAVNTSMTRNCSGCHETFRVKS